MLRRRAAPPGTRISLSNQLLAALLLSVACALPVSLVLGSLALLAAAPVVTVVALVVSLVGSGLNLGLFLRATRGPPSLPPGAVEIAPGLLDEISRRWPGASPASKAISNDITGVYQDAVGNALGETVRQEEDRRWWIRVLRRILKKS